MLGSASANALLIIGAQLFGFGAAVAGNQKVIGAPTPKHHTVDPAILAALDAYKDPVDALIAVVPDVAEQLAQPRLLHVFGEKEPRWVTEGEKLRLRRNGKKFRDITEHEKFYAEQANIMAGKAHLPKLTHQNLIKPLFSQVSTEHMYHVLEKMTSFYNRRYNTADGEQSAQWLHDHIAEIIKEAPFHTHISLEYFTHSFVQPSIVARFEPKITKFSHPLTIIGAHQDSTNQFFPLLPAPGADDDCSGTASILEAFRVLAKSGFTPLNGPVEFHWYAAEEAGLLGSQDIARYKRESGATIGAMLEFDMTAFVARNSTEKVAIVTSEADEPLSMWAVDLAKEYMSIESGNYTWGVGAGSDYMSYTSLGYPSAFATEGDPLAGGSFPGDFDPYVHTVKDTMYVNDTAGVFSVDHMARFSEFAIAFVVEQAGWDNKWR